MVKRDLNRRQAWWAAELANYEYTLHYKSGAAMKKADILSRRPDLSEGVERDNNQVQLLQEFSTKSWKLSGTILGTQGDSFLAEIKEASEEDYGWKVLQRTEESRQGTRKASDGATWQRKDKVVTRDRLIVVPKK